MEREAETGVQGGLVTSRGLSGSTLVICASSTKVGSCLSLVCKPISTERVLVSLPSALNCLEMTV